jgi:hypothetical protein
MSELGPLAYGTKDEPVFLGREFAQRADYSEDTANRIDHEVTRIVQTGYEAARSILSQYREVLERVARDLLERETLDGDEVYNTIRAMTGHDHAPTRPVPPGEGLVIGGHEVPESVVTAARAGAVGTTPTELPGAADVSDEVEAEVAGPKRRAAQPQPPVPEPEKSR